METNPVLLIPSPPLFCFPHNQAIPQCTLQYPSQRGSVWIGLSWFKCILWLTSLWLSCGVFFYRLDIDTRWLLESFSYWRWCGLSPLFCPQIMSVCLLFSASLLRSSPLALSACLCCLGRFLLHCHSDDVKDHGRENKGHWFLASWWAVVLWLKQLLKFTVGGKKRW